MRGRTTDCRPQAIADGSYWLYEHDSLGQVRSGRKYWADQTPVAGQQFEYAHDDIGNRTSTKAGGDQNGANLRIASYGANSLNQYTNRQVPGAVDVMGISFATNGVSVNNQAAYRKGEYFRAEVPVSNGSVPVWQSVTVVATNQATVSGNVFVPKTPEQFYYDADGNLTSDGRWQYTWDAENRLVGLTTNSTVGPRQSIKYEYDWQGRRIHKQVWANAGWSGTPTNDVKFVYGGWNLIGILNSSFTLQTSFVWGSDLSGSIQGAGGVGGLLFICDQPSAIGYSAPAYDGNGNVMALLSMSGGTNCAAYEYGPFGEVVRDTGPIARANPLRFSSKYQDEESDLVYYGRRYLSTSTERWLSRDPAGEGGGGDLYCFVRNGFGVDPLGLAELHYIDHPKWQVVSDWVGDAFLKEYLWVGHYLTFDSADAARISGGRGVLLVNHHSEATVTDCATEQTCYAKSENWYFANHFILNSGGGLVNADDLELFVNAQFHDIPTENHLFTQIANISMSGLMRRLSGLSGERLTRGTFHSEMTLRTISEDNFAPGGEPWITSGPEPYDETDINGHELTRSYWGRMANQTPASWSAPSFFDQKIVLNFSWDDCAVLCGGGNTSWNYQIWPWLTERGEQRWRYRNKQWPAADLVLQPSR